MQYVNGYYVAYKPITLSSILFIFFEMKSIYCHYCVICVMKSKSICSDLINYDDITIQRSLVFKKNSKHSYSRYSKRTPNYPQKNIII